VSASSRLVQVLQPLPVFAAEADATQDIGLHGVEELAWQAGWPESAVAHELAERMRQAGHQAARHASPDTSAPAEAAGHWLSGPGRAELRAALGLAPRPRALQWARSHALALYLLVLGLGSVALVWVLLAQAPGAAALGAAWP
jgi:hypothetical protein